MGCSETKVGIDTTDSIEHQSTAKQENPRHSSTCFIENSLLLWFIPTAYGSIDEDRKKLTKIVSFVDIFTDFNVLSSFIEKINFEKIFLIVPNLNEPLRKLTESKKIEEIYFLGQEDDPKKNSFKTIDELCRQLKIDVELFEDDSLLISSTNSNSSKEEKASFLIGQLFREISFRIEVENNNKEDFIKFSRNFYGNESEQINLIEEFDKSYRAQKCLLWLMKDSFVRRIIRRIEREQNLEIFCKISFIRKNIHDQLSLFQENNSIVHNDVFTVFRGKTMFNEEFNRLFKENLGGLVSFDGFLLTSIDKEISLDFVRQRCSKKPDRIGVIFEFNIDSSIRSLTCPFASLDQIESDEVHGQNQVLFSPHTVFRVESIGSFERYFSVKLNLIEDKDQQLNDFVSPLTTNDFQSNKFLRFAELLTEKGEYQRAEQIFLNLLKQTSSKNETSKFLRIKKSFAQSFVHRKDFSKALEHYKEALNLGLNHLSPEDTDLVSIYDAIGKIYYEQSDFKNALEFYERAAKSLGHDSQTINERFLDDLNSRINYTKTFLNN